MNSPTETIDTLFQLLTEQGTGDYIGENISQLDHCLQAAHSASLMNANTATILAALLHDVGQFLPGEFRNRGEEYYDRSQLSLMSLVP